MFQSDGITSLTGNASGVEDATTQLSLTGLPLGTETTAIVARIEATLPQDANVTGTYYQCVLAFK